MELVRALIRAMVETVKWSLRRFGLLILLLLGLPGFSVGSPEVANATAPLENETESGHPLTSSWDITDPGYSVPSLPAKIRTSTGTWMSLDVSPDGQQIVFDLLGDIYLLPIQVVKQYRLLKGFHGTFSHGSVPMGARLLSPRTGMAVIIFGRWILPQRRCGKSVLKISGC